MNAERISSVAINGVDLAYGRWGPDSGTPLVLCHGFSGGMIDFALQVEALADDRPVITLDQRGHGQAANLGTLDSYSLALLNADLVTFLDTVAGEPVDLLGHSMGGRVVLAAALQRPDLIRSLILMDTSAWSFQDEDTAMRELVAGFIAGYDPAGGLPELPLGGPEEELVVANVTADWLADRQHHRLSLDPYAIKALGLELFHSDSLSVRHRLSEITCPVTVICGSRDSPYIGQAPALVEELPRARLVVIDGAYHSPQLSHPQQWRAAVGSHFTEYAL
jgi:2-succinyl-6-hydroxy-2,4-cyclohexadiene-1-carboxylate synthase